MTFNVHRTVISPVRTSLSVTMERRSCLLAGILLLEMIIDIESVAFSHSFDPEASKRYTCKFVFPTLFSTLEESATAKSLLDGIKKRIIKLNCSLAVEEIIDIGEPDSNGTYNGFIGQIQRNEMSGAFWAFRPDSLPHEPGIIGSVWWPADVAILTKRKPRYQVTRDVLSVFVDIDNIMYVYTFYLVMIATVLMVIGKHLAGCGDSFWLSSVKVVYEYFWVLFGIHHPHLRRAHMSRKVLIASMSLFGFAFIIGFLQNRVGSDLCVFFGERDIDSVQDLLKDRRVLPWVTPRLWLFNILKASPNGTETNLIWKRVLENPELSIEKVTNRDSSQASVMTTVRSLMADTSAGRTATLVAEIIAKFSRDVGCIFQKEFAGKTTIAKETFAHGILSSVWSREMEKTYLRSINYLFSNVLEGGLWQGAFMLIKLTTLMPGIPINTATIACQEGFVDEELDWEPFNPHILKGTFGFLLSGLSLALIVFLLEKCYKRSQKKRLRRCPRIRIISTSQAGVAANRLLCNSWR